MNKSEAITAIRNGAIAACISAGMTIIIVVTSIYTDAEGMYALYNNPANFIDVVIILAFAFGVYKRSRVASVLMFIYFLAAKIIYLVETQAYAGLGIALVFLYLYGKAIQGAFVYHKIEKEENPGYKAASKWTYIIGAPFVLIVAIFIGFALILTAGIVPSARVTAKHEIKTSDISTLVSHGIIAANDNVDYFYSHGLLSILEGGNVLTQDRVIFYITDENEGLQVYEIPVIEITNVEMESQGNTFNDSVYKVNTKDPDRWIKLFLSVEQKGDQKFVKALRDRLER
ncbi:MAG: hypothetical protein R3C12_24390 [Planctomycetaceae bacterium]|nr:hypothetical protein [Planctomycetaceae bacterium]